MVTAAQWRRLALSMPESEEKSHFDQPDFRVNNKIFAGLDREQKRGSLKLNPELQAMVMEASPDVFEPAAGAWGRSGWTYVALARAELEPLRGLMRESYQAVAPKRLLTKQTAAKKARAKR